MPVQASRFYSSIAKSYNWLHASEQLEKARLIKGNLQPRGLLLDIGAGTGIATKIFQQECKCIALDPSIEMLRQFKGIKVCAKAEQLPFKSGSFDCIVSITALHHCNLKQALKEIKRVAKQNSQIAASFFKRAKSFTEAERLFAGFEKIDAGFDAVFLKK